MFFVTGGTGIVGARLIFDLLAKGENVRALRRSTSNMSSLTSVLDFYSEGKGAELVDRVEWVEGDISDIIVLEQALSGCHTCIHAAAIVSFHPRDHELMRQINIDGTANVVNACLAIGGIRLAYISSVAAIGRTASHQALSEKDYWKDSPFNSGYAISKYHAEMEVWRGVEEGLRAVIVNPTIIIGAGDVERSSGTIFGAVKKGLRFYTSGGASVVDVRDVSNVVLSLVDSIEWQSQRFILNSASLPYRQLFEEIADSLHMPRPKIHAGRLLLSWGWRLSALKDLIMRSKSSITKESAHSSVSAYTYSSAKIREAMNVVFIDWKESIRYHSQYYRDES